MLVGWVISTSWQTWAQMSENTEGLRSLAFNPTDEHACTRRQPTVLPSLPLHPYKMIAGWVVSTSWQTWAHMNQNTEGLRSLSFLSNRRTRLYTVATNGPALSTTIPRTIQTFWYEHNPS